MSTKRNEKSNKSVLYVLLGIAGIIAWQSYSSNSHRECQGYVGQSTMLYSVIAAQWSVSKGCQITTVVKFRPIVGEEPIPQQMDSRSFELSREMDANILQ